MVSLSPYGDGIWRWGVWRFGGASAFFNGEDDDDVHHQTILHSVSTGKKMGWSSIYKLDHFFQHPSSTSALPQWGTKMPTQTTDALFGLWEPKMTPKTCYVFVWGWTAKNIRHCVSCAWLGGRGLLNFWCVQIMWFEKFLHCSSFCNRDGGDEATHHQLLYKFYGEDLGVGMSSSI